MAQSHVRRFLPPLRPSDGRAVDSVDRGPDALAAMSGARRFVTHPAFLWLPAVLLFALGMTLVNLPFRVLADQSSDDTYYHWGMVLGALVGYGFVQLFERRGGHEMTSRPLFWGGTGLLLGAGLLAGSVGVVHLLGGLSFDGSNKHVRWAGLLLSFGLVPAVSEELVFRGLVFRYLEQGFWTWAATGLSALFFGFTHIGNPNATVAGAVAIALEAGIMFAVLYALTRSMWLVMGVHFAWNVMQGPVFGISVSGNRASDGWLVTSPHGNDLISGGAFGMEGSVVAIVLCAIVSGWAIVMLVRRGTAVAPAWARRRTASV